MIVTTTKRTAQQTRRSIARCHRVVSEPSSDEPEGESSRRRQSDLPANLLNRREVGVGDAHCRWARPGTWSIDEALDIHRLLRDRLFREKVVGFSVRAAPSPDRTPSERR